MPILRDGWGPSYYDGRLYYLTDANNNVTTLLSSSGSVLERYAYNAYGFAGTTFCADPNNYNYLYRQWVSAYGNTILFGCMDLDTYTGLYHTETRWYDPMLGVFTTRDPAQADPNFYRYCGNNPISRTDPTGLYTTYNVLPCGQWIMSACPYDYPWAQPFWVVPNCTFSGFQITTYSNNWTMATWSVTGYPDGGSIARGICMWPTDGSGAERWDNRFWGDTKGSWFFPWNNPNPVNGVDTLLHYGKYVGWGMIIVGSAGTVYFWGPPAATAAGEAEAGGSSNNRDFGGENTRRSVLVGIMP